MWSGHSERSYSNMSHFVSRRIFIGFTPRPDEHIFLLLTPRDPVLRVSRFKICLSLGSPVRRAHVDPLLLNKETCVRSDCNYIYHLYVKVQVETMSPSNLRQCLCLTCFDHNYCNYCFKFIIVFFYDCTVRV